VGEKIWKTGGFSHNRRKNHRERGEGIVYRNLSGGVGTGRRHGKGTCLEKRGTGGRYVGEKGFGGPLFTVG